MKLTDIGKFRRAIDEVYESDKYKKLRKDMDKYLAYYRGDFWAQNKDMHSETDSGIFINYIFINSF